MRMTAEELANSLGGMRKVGNQFSAQCPAHDDKTPSLDITDGDQGVIMICRSGCDQDRVIQQVCERLDIKQADLFYENHQHEKKHHGQRRLVEIYDYEDLQNTHLFQVLRYELPNGNKTFRQRRPDPENPDKFIYNLQSIEPILYRLGELVEGIRAGKSIYIPEGERCVDTLRQQFGLIATCNPGGAKKWRDSFNDVLRGTTVILLPDNDSVGREHTLMIATALHNKANTIKIVNLPNLEAKGDIVDWIKAGGTKDQLEALVAGTPIWNPLHASGMDASVWSRAIPATEFVEQPDEYQDAHVRDLIMPGAITSIAAPRGTGKTMVALAMAIALAKGDKFRGEWLKKLRVLLVDRDNPSTIVKRRLRNFGVEGAENLRVITRVDAPSLLESDTWASFPVDQHDVVIIDSLGAATEGVSEKEGKQTQQFLATLKDLAHRGLAILVLDNTDKAARSYRGRSEKADALDILYECRDITNWTPPDADNWWEHLPEAGDHAWQSRASRRTGEAVIRLAFVPSKFRLGVEPEPFCLEIDTTEMPWTLRDITEQIATLGAETARQERQETRQRFEHAANALVVELKKRPYDDPMLKTEARDFLRQFGLSQRQATNLLENGYNADVHPKHGKWRLEKLANRKGNPFAVFAVERSKSSPPFDSESSDINKHDTAEPHEIKVNSAQLSLTRTITSDTNSGLRNPSNGADFPAIDFDRRDITEEDKSEAVSASNDVAFEDGQSIVSGEIPTQSRQTNAILPNPKPSLSADDQQAEESIEDDPEHCQKIFDEVDRLAATASADPKQESVNDDDVLQLHDVALASEAAEQNKGEHVLEEPRILVQRFVDERCSRITTAREPESDIMRALSTWLRKEGLLPLPIDIVREALLDLGFTREQGINSEWLWRGLVPDLGLVLGHDDSADLKPANGPHRQSGDT